MEKTGSGKIRSAEQKARSDKRAVALVAALSLAFNIGLFSPIDFYLNNISDIGLPYKIILYACLPVGAVLFALLFSVIYFTKGKAHTLSLCIVTGLNLAFYVQGNFMSVGMHTLDGEAYSVSVIRAVLDLLLWAVLLALPFVILKKAEGAFRKFVLLSSAAVIVIEFIAVLSTFISISGSGSAALRGMISDSTYLSSCDTANEFTYSKTGNHIIFVVDQYDSFIYDNAVSQEPQSVSGFDGFTYYDNTVGMYGYTDRSVSYLLSNKPIEKDEDTLLNYTGDTLLDHVPEDYSVELYFDGGFLPNDYARKQADNISERSLSIKDIAGIGAALYDMVLYRTVPDAVKGPFWMYTGDFINKLSSVKSYFSDTLSFYHSLPDEIGYTDKPCCKLFYLQGIHVPRTVSKDLERETGREISPTESAVAVNKVLSEYFELLKKGGVYDCSDIVVLVDHGHRPNYDGRYPLLMIKRAGDTGEGVKISRVPVSYADFYPTELYLLGDESKKDSSVFGIPEGEKRERYYAETDEYTSEDVDRSLPLNESGL